MIEVFFMVDKLADVQGSGDSREGAWLFRLRLRTG